MHVTGTIHITAMRNYGFEQTNVWPIDAQSKICVPAANKRCPEPFSLHLLQFYLILIINVLKSTCNWESIEPSYVYKTLGRDSAYHYKSTEIYSRGCPVNYPTVKDL